MFTELRKEQIFAPFGRDSAYDEYAPSLSPKKLDLPQIKISYTPSMDILVCFSYFYLIAVFSSLPRFLNLKKFKFLTHVRAVSFHGYGLCVNTYERLGYD